ncbi:MAG: acetyl-CoA hydrolase/transferase C-terminal domain-containing protein, partial [Pseudomonas sp.]
MALCSLDHAVEQILQRIDGPIHLGLPLGLGKPNRLVNALYQRIKAEPQRSLTIYTALSLGRPHASSELEKRLMAPFLERVFGNYPELDYLQDQRHGTLPANVQLQEFYLQPGSQLHNPQAQQQYVSLNYSQVARDLNRKGINVVAQLVAADPMHPDHLSLSCNTDITLDLLPMLQARKQAGETILCVGQVHADLPYMPGDAERPQDDFDLLIEAGEPSTLFSTPNMPVGIADHAIGLYASSLVRDGGTLQIGIGSMGDAVTAALLNRQRDNSAYQAVLDTLHGPRWASLIEQYGGVQPFAKGLYGCSEMLVPGLVALFDAGIVRRPVFPDKRLQGLANCGVLDEQGQLDLAAWRDTEPDLQLDQPLVGWLQSQGLLAEEVSVEGPNLRFANGQMIVADLHNPACVAALQPYLRPTRAGVCIHGGFFLGPQAFYRRLQQLDDERRSRIGMTGIGFINRLYGQETLKRLQRGEARFINSAFCVTLLGASAADQLEDGRVISGVGGQYDFFAQAHALDDARAILMLRSWREAGGEVSSNIRWQYAHTTIPRHLRDIVITEYGIADLRGKNDEQVIIAMLQIADSRFQDELIWEAQEAGKLAKDFVLAAEYRDNTPARLQGCYEQHRELFAEYPLGCDFTEQEQDLLRALRWLKSKLKLSEILELGKAALF